MSNPLLTMEALHQPADQGSSLKVLPPTVYTEVADGHGAPASSWMTERVLIPVFAAMLAGGASWLVTWGSLTTRIENMQEQERALAERIPVAESKINSIELQGSHGLQEFKVSANTRMDGIDRVLSEREARLNQVEQKMILLQERQTQQQEKMLQLTQTLSESREATRNEHERLTKMMDEVTTLVARQMSAGGGGIGSYGGPPPATRRP